jgi:hypothetical protein
VPLVTQFARSELEQRALELILAPQSAGRPYLAPPGVPEDRLTALRAGFDAAARDPALLAAARRLKLEVTPMAGTDIAALLARLYASPGDAVQAARQVLKAGAEKPAD